MNCNARFNFNLHIVRFDGYSWRGNGIFALIVVLILTTKAKNKTI